MCCVQFEAHSRVLVLLSTPLDFLKLLKDALLSFTRPLVSEPGLYVPSLLQRSIRLLMLKYPNKPTAIKETSSMINIVTPTS